MDNWALIKIKVEPQGGWPTTEAFIKRLLEEIFYSYNGVRIEIETTIGQGALAFLEKESPKE